MWNEIYSPIEDIDEDLYKDLMHPITLDELNIVIVESSKDKAAGPSGITKLMMKILTKRLSNILYEHKILNEFNFAGLKNGSMFEPLKIIQTLIEDANKHNKEL
ncbi:hypothetical protein RhiirC2_799544 [Rhizophagus irregularis]|uniref:Uncharacterized protein n=1 Tax=Rhizophagus irregularis TaxID=588596 RepID=A0A2N1M4T8_9GLOM|nr:hypothetical protein RhiirC2_799544 [Rhizophagus irregularis]